MYLVFVRESNTVFSLKELSEFHKEANSTTKSAEGVIAPKDAMQIRIQHEMAGSPKKTDVVLIVKLVCTKNKNWKAMYDMRDVWITIGEHFGWKEIGVLRDDSSIIGIEPIDAVINHDDWLLREPDE